jgi:hypothetical protein
MIGVVVCRDFFSQSTGASLLVFLFFVGWSWIGVVVCRLFSQSTGASSLFFFVGWVDSQVTRENNNLAGD